MLMEFHYKIQHRTTQTYKRQDDRKTCSVPSGRHDRNHGLDLFHFLCS